MKFAVDLYNESEITAAAVNQPAPWPTWYPGSGWESRVDIRTRFIWAAEHWHYSFYLSALYLVAVYLGIQWMKPRKAYPFKWTLVAWNLTLAIFSGLGAYRLIPYVLYQLYHGGYAAVVCTPPFIQRDKLVLWSLLFSYSKIWEFGDTAFLVLRKRPVIALHWIHHSVTCVACFYGQQSLQIACLQMVAINYSIHVVMYAYYGARAAGIKISARYSSWITRAQIVQMFVNLAANSYAWYLLSYTDFPCTNDRTVLIVTTFILTLFAALFINFFIKAYILRVRVKRVPSTKSFDGTAAAGAIASSLGEARYGSGGDINSNLVSDKKVD